MGYVRDAILGTQGGGIAQLTEGSDKLAMELKHVRGTVAKAAFIPGETRRAEKAANQAITKVVFEQLRFKPEVLE